jgi:hypothetical protein
MISMIPNTILILAMLFGVWVMKQYLPFAMHDPPMKKHEVERLGIFRPWKVKAAEIAPPPPPAANKPGPGVGGAAAGAEIKPSQ